MLYLVYIHHHMQREYIIKLGIHLRPATHENALECIDSVWPMNSRKLCNRSKVHSKISISKVCNVAHSFESHHSPTPHESPYRIFRFVETLWLFIQRPLAYHFPPYYCPKSISHHHFLFIFTQYLHIVTINIIIIRHNLEI